MRTYVQKFADKTFMKVGYAAKFVKVFTRKSFQLYGTLWDIIELIVLGNTRIHIFLIHHTCACNIKRIYIHSHDCVVE